MLSESLNQKQNFSKYVFIFISALDKVYKIIADEPSHLIKLYILNLIQNQGFQLKFIIKVRLVLYKKNINKLKIIMNQF